MKKKIIACYITLIPLLNTICFAEVTKEQGEAKITGVIGWIGGACRVMGICSLVFGAIHFAMSFSNDDASYRQRALLLLAGGVALYNAEFIINGIMGLNFL